MITSAATRLRALIVDDYPDSTYALAKLLEILNCEVEICQDPTQSVPQALRHRPQLILLDLAMPGMDGFAVGEALRHAGLGPALVVALSGHGEQAIQERCRQSGFDAFVLKPASLEVLRELVWSAGHLESAPQ